MTAKARRPDRVVATPEECREAVLDAIRGATRRLSLSLFRCNDKEIFEELAAARKRGVEVDAIVTARAAGSTKKLKKLRQKLLDADTTVHIYADPVVKYHAKYLVADEGPAIVASLNFTKKCFSRTLDALVVTYDPAVVAGLREVMAVPTSIPAWAVVLSLVTACGAGLLFGIYPAARASRLDPVEAMRTE